MVERLNLSLDYKLITKQTFKDGKCVDIDECEQPDRCITGATCTNEVGSFTCQCSQGFRPYETKVC